MKRVDIFAAFVKVVGIGRVVIVTLSIAAARFGILEILAIIQRANVFSSSTVMGRFLRHILPRRTGWRIHRQGGRLDVLFSI